MLSRLGSALLALCFPAVLLGLGVRAAMSSVETLDLAHRAVEALLAEHGFTAAEIHLTVVHVNGTQ